MIRPKLQNLTLGRKFAGLMILFIFLPLCAAAIVMNATAADALTAKTKDNLLQTLMQTRFSLDNMIRETDYLSLTILSDEPMQELIKYYERKAYLDMEKSKAELYLSFQSLLDSRPFIHSIAISREGEILFQYGAPVTREDTRFDEQAKALKGRVLWTPVYPLSHLAKGDGSVPVVSLVRAINDLDSPKQLAIERISIEESTLTRLYAGVHSWSGGGIFILDPSGDVLSSPDSSLLQPGAVERRFGRRPAWADASEGYVSLKDRRIPSTAFFYTMPTTGWKVVEIIPNRELSPQIGLVNRFILVCMTICLVFGVLFALLQNRSVIRPLKQLHREMSKVKNGSFQIKLDIRTGDEIGRVAFIFTGMVKQIQDLIERVYKSQIREKEAELKAMQAQIDPHFLYNTLDSIRWMAVKNKDYPVGEQIEALSDLFRHSLNQGRETTTLKDEIDHLRNYWFIQQNRFSDRLACQIEVDPALYDCTMPKLVLQPLVENAIVHGLEDEPHGGLIQVRVSGEEGTVVMTVQDNGKGTDPLPIRAILRSVAHEREAFALLNIHERIRLRYGDGFGIEFDSSPGRGTSVTVRIPEQRITKEER